MQKTINPGFILINKPAGRSSFSIVAQIKRLLVEGGIKRPKVGHAGTLDPFATGLLIIAIGREATKYMTQFLKMDKKYRATVKFGLLTDTLDCTGTVITEQKFTLASKEEVENAFSTIGNTYEQIPPIYSALKFQGTRFYKLARRDIIPKEQMQTMLERKKRSITIHGSSVVSCSPDEAIIDVHVSHGTYVRSLMNDIAKEIGTVGTTIALERLSIGTSKIENSYSIDSINSFDQLIEKIILVENFVNNL